LSSRKRRFDLKPQRLSTAGGLPQGEKDVLDELHLFESTGLVGLKTAAVAAMATSGQLLTGLFRPNRRLITEHLEGWLSGSTHLPALQAKEISTRLELSTQQLMLELMPVARTHARAAISHYRVGVVAQGNSGDLYLGFNLEFPENPLVQTVNAEQSVVVNAMLHGEKGLKSLAVNFAPSGFSRQFLYELPSGGELKIHLPDRSIKLKALLPSNFGPRDLGSEGALMNSHRNSLVLIKGNNDPVVQHALEASNRAYAPYSNCPSGVSLATEDQSYAGSYCENAAFNPSLSPFQSAIISLYCHGRELHEVKRVVLVERAKKHADQIMQAGATRLLVQALMPNIELELHEARVS